MTNLQTNTGLAASHNLNLFEVVLVWTTKNKYSLPHFQYFVTKREKFNSSQGAELWLWTTCCTETPPSCNWELPGQAQLRLQERSQELTNFRWILNFNWGEKGKMHISNTSELMSWNMKFKPAAKKGSPGKPQQWLKEMGCKGKPKPCTVTLPQPGLSPPGAAFQSTSAKPPIPHHLQSPAPLENKPNAPGQHNWGSPGSMRTQKLRP